MHDNLDNENTVFNLYFIVKPSLESGKIINFIKLNEHFSKYPLEFIAENIVKFYKNTGLLKVSGILVFYPLYDINNLIQISSGIKAHFIQNIEIINNNVHKDLNNTIINYTNKFDVNSEIILMIHADYDTIVNINQKLKKN